jgi:DNA-binding transcriptional regulator YbjK
MNLLMPTNPARRIEILDAAIDVLADTGIGGLTHRQVDARVDLPVGTTSNYFRTRLALLEATAARVVDLHWQSVNLVQDAIGPVDGRDGLVALVARMMADADADQKRRYIARFELFLEGTRRPELLPFLNDLQEASMKSARLILQAAGLSASDEKVGEMSRLLNGLAFSSATLSKDMPGREDPEGLADRLVTSVLGIPG